MRGLLKTGFSLLVLAIVLIALSYSMLRANGVSAAAEGRQVASETRELPPGVNAVELNGPIDLNVRYGATPSLRVRGEQRLLGNVEVGADGSVLHVGIRGIVLRHRKPLEVELVLPALTGITVDGSGDSKVNGFSGERIDVRLDGSGSLKFNGRFRKLKASLNGSGDLDVNAGAAVDEVEAELMGSGRMTVVGTTRELDAEASGSGELDARHLRAQRVSVTQTGSGSSTVQARSSVAAAVSGSGDIEVHGNPDERSVSRTGSGSVSFSE
ncbi:head GIN domain-containing protein [Massilia niastensis]|uniref:head GIN domain-containing protein n=1 Tax=Massilia niastensis TaxID=544911 RepID=UPI0003826BF8|nr:head GIN domain-containing protein [Massilia niastensis]